MTIRRTLIATIGAAFVGAAMLSAQSGPSVTPTTTASNTTYRGCVNPGAGDKAFLLTAAVEKGSKNKDKVSLKLVAGSEKIKIENFLSRDVEVQGTLDAAPASSGASENGETLRTFTVTKITWKADYCG